MVRKTTLHDHSDGRHRVQPKCLGQDCIIIIIIIIIICLFKATPMAYGGSQARGQNGTYTTAIATPDLSHDCHLHHSSGQHRILNPLSEARDRTCLLMDASQISFC